MTDSPRGSGLGSSASRAVLFDLDGTLIDSRRLYLEAYRRALAPALGRALSDAEILHARPRSELRYLVSQLPAPPGQPPDTATVEACLAAFYRAYGTLHDTLFDGRFEGAYRVLDALRAEGVPLGLVTGKTRRAWNITGTHIRLPRFDVMVFDDDVAHPKPDPEGLRLALDQLRLAPAQATYVGDTMGDVAAARAAGMRAVAVTWSRPPEMRADFAAHARSEGARVADSGRALLEIIG